LVGEAERGERKAAAMNAYNRYTIAVRGASSNFYGTLAKAQVEKEL
jgi:hypothetical protein